MAIKAKKSKRVPKPTKSHPGRRGNAVSLAPLTTEQALAALVQVKLSDVKKIEAQEKRRRN